MGGDTLRHVVSRRVHLERAQPKGRKHLGLLEKHKDYVLRARDFHKKEKKLR
jgi:U3 small nucleolar RNA-associated protein 11